MIFVLLDPLLDRAELSDSCLLLDKPLASLVVCSRGASSVPSNLLVLGTPLAPTAVGPTPHLPVDVPVIHHREHLVLGYADALSTIIC